MGAAKKWELEQGHIAPGATVVDALMAAARSGQLLRVGAGDHGPGVELSRVELLERGATFAAALRRQGLTAGDRVFLLLPTGPELLTSIIGCWLNRCVLVIGAPFRPLGRSSLFIEELTHKLSTVQPKLIVSRRKMDVFAEIQPLDSMRLEDFDELMTTGPAGEKLELPRGSDLALLQFTSGSTSAPKATKIYHYQLVENIRAIAERISLSSADRVLTWFPLYHDMGLVGGVLAPLYTGAALDLIPTEVFARDPSSWLRLITEAKPTGSLAPPFALSILAKRIPSFKLKGLDLSSLRFIITGAEPIALGDLDAFRDRFAVYGLRDKVILPSYGMSEATLAVSIQSPAEAYHAKWIDLQALRESGRVRLADRQAPLATPIMSVAKPLQGFEVSIRREGVEVDEATEGTIFIRGPSVTHGYWGFQERDPMVQWHDTGDTGFLFRDELYVTGRIKDVMKRGGVAYHPSGLEKAAERVWGLRKGRLAAFSHFDPSDGLEKFIIAIEIKAWLWWRAARIEEQVSRTVLETCGVRLDEVVVTAPGSVPKTSSGKIQRGLCKELYLRNSLRHIRNPWGRFIGNTMQKLRRIR